MTSRILVVKTSSLGDVVHALAAVNDALQAGFEVDWVVEEGFADIPRAHPGVSTVIEVAWRRWRRHLRSSQAEMLNFYRTLRSRDYELVIDSQGLLKSSVISLFARGATAGFSHTSAREPWGAFFYRHRHRVAQGGHAIDRQRALFAKSLGYSLSEEWRTGIERPRTASNQVFLLHGTTWDTKHWPESMWLDLIDRYLAAGLQPLVTWGDELERARAGRLVDAGATMIDRRPIRALMDLLSGCALVVAVDSGLGHLAAALGVPTIGLYGATSGELTGCRGQTASFIQGETACAPCMRKQCRAYRGPALEWQGRTIVPPCFASVTPERVFSTSRRWFV